MKKIFLLTAAMMFSACLFAQGITGRGASDDITDAETFEAEKTKTEIIIPKDSIQKILLQVLKLNILQCMMKFVFTMNACM